MQWIKHLACAATCIFLAAQFSTGCGSSGKKSGGSGRDQEGLDMCCELGALCHDEGPAATAEKADCHEKAHENDPSWCRANYDRCLEICAPSGEGGGGGEGGAHQEHFCVTAEQ